MSPTKVEFRHRDWGRLLTKYAESAIGRTPEIRISSPNRVVAVFEPALSDREKAKLDEALPEWIRYLFDVEATDYD